MLKLLGLVEPRQVILVTSSGKVEVLGKELHKDNIITVDWHMPCSYQPFRYAIAIGKTEFTHRMIEESGVFCVNFMPADYKEEIVLCGSQSGQMMDKFDKTGLRKEPCETIECVRLKESLAFLECESENSIDAGDHTIFIGKVTNHRLKAHAKRLLHLDGKRFTTTEEY